MLKRWQRFRHYFGIGATQLEVHSRLAWVAYAASGAGMALLLVAGAFFLSPRNPALPQEAATLQARIVHLEQQLEQREATPVEQEVSYSARRQLSEKLGVLTEQQAVLEEDLAYALRLVPVGVPEGGTRLDRLMVWPDAVSNQTYHFSVLVGYTAGRSTQEFNGVLKFTLTVLRDGKTLQLSWPEKNQADHPEYQVSVRQWTRKTGELEIAPGDVLKKVELKLLQGNVQRALVTVTL
ncbi:MAG: hypothetical protein LBS89_05925 [Zoogloeaceae bacterium]|jgi:hypothetical protein|nr:hypothetical protein [Zoogloeaceae bacterium]